MKDYDIKINKVEQAIKDYEYKKALKALATIIMILNIEIVKKKYIQDLKKMNFYGAMEIYRMYNQEIYNIMVDINYIYETTKEKVEISDVMELKKLCEKLKEFLV